MSNIGLSPAAPIGGRKPPANRTCVVSTCRRAPTNWVSDRTLQPLTEPVVANFAVPSDFLVGRPIWWAEDWAPPSNFRHLHHMLRYCHVIGPTLLKTTFCAHRFFYFFTASYGTEGTIAGHVVLPRSIMVHHGF